MRVDNELLRRAGVEFAVALRRVVERNDLHADDFGDVDLVPQDRLHQRAVVLHHRRLAREEAVRLGPAEAEANAQRAHLRRLVDATRIVRHVKARDADLAGRPRDLHQRVQHRGGRFVARAFVAVAARFEAHRVDGAVDLVGAEQLRDLVAERACPARGPPSRSRPCGRARGEQD